MLTFLLTILTLTQVNWPQVYAYCPQVKVEYHCSDDSLYLHWIVDEQNVRGTVTSDRGPVYTDSAVEFFCLLPDGKHYTNFEFNCLGYCLSDIQLGMFAEGRSARTKEELASLPRKASLGREAVGDIPGITHWELETAIPLRWILPESAWTKSGRLRRGTTIQGNFYKCADRSQSPHYVSLFPIDTPHPNFHQPTFFRKIRLK